MDIKDILRAQQRAAQASKKAKPASVRTAIVKHTSELLAEQRKLAQAAQKGKPKHVPVPKPANQPSVAQLVAAQKMVADAQAAAKKQAAGANQAPAAIIEKYKEEYNDFLKKLEEQIQTAEPVFVPNVNPETTQVEVKEVEPAVNPDVNGISVGEEAGGAVEIVVKPKRRVRKPRIAPQEPVAEEPVEKPAEPAPEPESPVVGRW